MFIQVLAVTRDSAGWINDAIRSVFWFFAKGVLILLDGMWLIIDDIWKFKFFDNDYVNKIYSAAIIVACTWLILKVILEFLMHHILNQDEHSTPLSVWKGIIISITLMFLIPPVFNWGYDLSSKLTQYVVSASTSAETSPVAFEATMSSMILSAMADDNKMEESDKKYFIENWFFEDYNATINGGLLSAGEYKYSFNTFNVFLVGLVVVVLLFFIGIQVAKRVIELALYKAIAPFVCTSMISNRSRSFEVWVKGVMGTFLVTTVQYLCIGILFNVFGTVVKSNVTPMAIILIMIGALLFIISSPSLVTTLLNANTGAMSNFSEMHSIMALGTSMIAMSKYGKTSDNSNNSNTNSDNSTTNNSNSSDSGGDPNMTNNTSGTSSLEATNANNNSDSNNSSDSSTLKSENGSLPASSSESNSSYANDLPSMNNTTSLDDRINVYKDMTDTNYNLNHNSDFSYKTTADWGLSNNVFNTKEHKS